MTREEAFNELNDRIKSAEYVDSDYIDGVSVDAVKTAISALSVPETNVGDTIYRQAAIDEIKALYKWHDIVTEDRAIDHFKRLPSAQQWTPCSERSPEENVWTICQNNAGAMMIGKYDIEFGWIFPAYFDGIVAWMPLPEPYKGEES